MVCIGCFYFENAKRLPTEQEPLHYRFDRQVFKGNKRQVSGILLTAGV